MQEPIHSYVKRLREARGKWLSQRRLAKLAGLAPSTVFRLEAGKHPPTAETLAAIAPHLAVSVDELLDRAGFRAVRPEVAQPPPPPSLPHAADLPADPMLAVATVLAQGVQPEAVTFCLYAILAAYADNKADYWRRRFDEEVARLREEAASASITVEWRTSELPPAEGSDRTAIPSQWSILRERLFGRSADGPAPASTRH